MLKSVNMMIIHSEKSLHQFKFSYREKFVFERSKDLVHKHLQNTVKSGSF